MAWSPGSSEHKIPRLYQNYWRCPEIPIDEYEKKFDAINWNDGSGRSDSVRTGNKIKYTYNPKNKPE